MIVVGAGAAGLGAATQLGDALLVDRIPVAGGIVAYDHPDVRAAVRAAERAGVRLKLGATALRWQDHKLLIAAPGEIVWHEADALVFAGGLRPATAAELGLTGDRPAGVLPASVAKHLLEADPNLWERPVIVGEAFNLTRARRVGHITAVLGRQRVTAVRTDSETIECDAVLLADAPRPVRNIEGAIADDATDVIYLQDLATHSFNETVEKAREVLR
jgi:hypothetical protein